MSNSKYFDYKKQASKQAYYHYKRLIKILKLDLKCLFDIHTDEDEVSQLLTVTSVFDGLESTCREAMESFKAIKESYNHILNSELEEDEPYLS